MDKTLLQIIVEAKNVNNRYVLDMLKLKKKLNKQITSNGGKILKNIKKRTYTKG